MEKLQKLAELKTTFDESGKIARTKLSLLRALRGATFDRARAVEAYHDLLLFMRAHPDDARILEESERQLAGFAARIRAFQRSATEREAALLHDTGIIGTPVGNVFSYELTRSLVKTYGARVDVDWDNYWASDTADIATVLTPLLSWCEVDALDNDEAFDAQHWLELSRCRGDANALAALITLAESSRLPRALVRTLYESAEIPVTWDLTSSPASRTLKRMPWDRPYYQRAPFGPRTKDLRGDLARPAARLVALSRPAGEAYVRAIREVLGSRCRELYPLIHSNPAEVYVSSPGHGVQLVIFGNNPDIRLPLESNFGAMLVKNGVPIGYGIGAMLFERAEIAINVFPAYRNGESSFIIEHFFRLFAQHFGAKALVVRSFQVGDDNEEALLSGSFWFYYKLGFRPVKPRVRALADAEARRLAATPGAKTPLPLLERIAKSDVFFHCDPDRMKGYDELRVAELGYAVTRFIAAHYGGDRGAAERGAVNRVARTLGIRGWREWTPDEITGFHRIAPLIACIRGLERWSRDEKRQLALIVRAKGGRREREFALLSNSHRRFERAMRAIARRERERRLSE